MRFGKEVLTILPIEREGEVRLLRLVVRDVASGELQELLARNVVLATGGVPRLPDGIEL